MLFLNTRNKKKNVYVWQFIDVPILLILDQNTKYLSKTQYKRLNVDFWHEHRRKIIVLMYPLGSKCIWWKKTLQC
jgi:hypothetical protein